MPDTSDDTYAARPTCPTQDEARRPERDERSASPAVIFARPTPGIRDNSGARRAARYAQVFAAGYHPITKALLAENAAPLDDPAAPGRRCGTCWYRGIRHGRGKPFSKCLNPGPLGADEIDEHGYPFASRTAATDVLASWPACVLHTHGEPALSADAARYVPEGSDER